MKPLPCPCGSGRSLMDCCEPLHGGEPPTDAAALMRSRYTAYTLGNMDYILESWHRSTRPDDVSDGFNPDTRWLGLSIKGSRMLADDEAEVEFVARFKNGGGPAQRLHEVSRFRCEQGRWYYVDGELKN